MDIKKILLFILVSIFNINLTFDGPANGPSPEELMENLMKNFSPEEQEAIMAEAKRIEDHLGSLSPEDRAREEQMLMEEADKMWQEMMGEPPAPPKPEPVITPKVEAPKKETTKEKPAPKKDLSKLENALDSIVDSLNSIALKAQGLPRVSTKPDFEAAWPKREAEFTYVRSLMKTVRNLPKVLNVLAQKENLMLAKNITAFSEILKEKESSLKVPDTAKLKKESSKNDIKNAQDQLESIVNHANITFESGMIAQLRGLLNKVAPEELKRQEKKSGSMPTNFAPNTPSPFGPHKGRSQNNSNTGSGFGYDPYYDEPYFYPGPHATGGTPANKDLVAKKQAPAKKDAAKDKEVDSKEPANESGKSIIQFKKSLNEVDEKLDEYDLSNKLNQLSTIDEKGTSALERDLLPAISEVQRDLANVKKHAKKVLEKGEGSKEVLKKAYEDSKVSKIGSLDNVLESAKSNKALKDSTADEVASLNKGLKKLRTLVSKEDPKK